MARTKLTIAAVRVPTPLGRAKSIKAKMDDLDDDLDAHGVQVVDEAGAIALGHRTTYIDATEAGMALTLADGTVAGETMALILRSKTADGTAVVTPTTFAGGATITFDTVGEKIVLIWVAAGGWTAITGATAAVA